MERTRKNRGAGTAPVSHDPIGHRSRNSLTAPGWRWQLIATRYRLPPAMARQVELHCFGEAAND